MKKTLLLILALYFISHISAENLQLFQAGQKAFSVGLYSIALENLNQYLDSDGLSKREDSLYIAGVSSYYLKKYKEAEAYFNALESDYSGSAYFKRSLYWQGLCKYNSGNFDTAIIYFNKNTQYETPYKGISNLYLALSYIKNDDFNGAEEAFLSIIENPDSKKQYIGEALYRLGTIYLDKDRINDSINTLNRIVYNYPDSKYFKDSLSIVADSYYLLKEWDNALNSYNLLLDYVTDKQPLYKKIATIYWELDDKEKSLNYLLLCKDSYSSDIDVLNMLGDIYFNENRYKDAINTFSIIDKLPNINISIKNENNYRLAMSYYKMGDFNNSFIYFNKVESVEAVYFTILSGLEIKYNVDSLVRKINNNYPNNKLSLDATNRYINSFDYLTENKIKDDFLNFITKLYYNNLDYSLTYGEYLLEERRYEESIKYLSKGYYEGSPYYSNLSYKLGWIYYNKNELNRALTYFNRVERDNENYDKAIYSKSIIYYKLGNYSKGEEGFKDILEMDSGYKYESSYYLGLIEKSRYNYKKALTYFKVSLDSNKLYIEARKNMAWCYYFLEDYNNALDLYLDLENDFNSANCYLYLKDYNNALLYYNKVISNNGDNTSSAYYKIIEILFLLGRDDDAYNIVIEYRNRFNKSDLPFAVLLSEGNNRLYNNNYKDALELFNNAIDIFKTGNPNREARYKKGESLRLAGLNNEAAGFYISSIAYNDKYKKDSTENIILMMKELNNPDYNNFIITNIESKIDNKSDTVPIYIEYINQNITTPEIINLINKQLEIAIIKDDIEGLIYLKGLYFYNIENYTEAENNIDPLLEREEVSNSVKIDASILKSMVLTKLDLKQEAIDLLLNLYINFPDEREKASLALYKALNISREINNVEMEDKIKNIITSEYGDTYWGIRLKNEI